MLVGFHTTALCTTGTVSRGSSGRCFFTAVVVEEEAEEEVEEEAGAVVGVALGRVAEDMVVGATVVKDTMLSGMAIGDWEGSLALGVEEGAVLL